MFAAQIIILVSREINKLADKYIDFISNQRNLVNKKMIEKEN